MRRLRHIGFARVARTLAACAVPLTAVTVAHTARAQLTGTANKPLPNVLLLVDTSGSMERMADSSMPSQNVDPDGLPLAGPVFNKCQPGVESNPNRWGMLVQALTGNLQPFYSCDAISRENNPQFRNEYKINDKLPYDDGYFLPYHRPLTGSGTNACAFAPYTLPGAPMGSGIGPGKRGSGGKAEELGKDTFASVKYSYLQSQYGSGSGSVLDLTVSTNECIFDQANDGQLDATKDFVRFALMTFDNDTLAGVGVNPTTSPVDPSATVDTASPFLGQWTYVKSPSNPGAIGFGNPKNCATGPDPFDVGARHWAAPPWEGRMVRFADPEGTLYDLEAVNQNIQDVILSTRPYGATPIDGMMEDARDYLWYNSFGPNGSVAGYADPYVASGCRDQYIILLTDGAPNLNLRPQCEPNGGGVNGVCPFPNTAAEVANALAQATGKQKVTTYVIGFSVNGETPSAGDGFPAHSPPYTSCKAWYESDPNMHTTCSTPATAPPRGTTADACCQLEEIAYFGKDDHSAPPFFAETQADLVLSFGRVLASVAKSATTRTVPGYSPVVRYSTGPAMTADFTASFVPNAQKVWSGEIERTRSQCVGVTPTPILPQSVPEGDSYASNLANQAGANGRKFISVLAPRLSGKIDSSRTLRPWVNVATPSYSDGLVDVTPTEQILGQDPSAMPTDWPDAMQITDNTCKRSKTAKPGQPDIPIPRLSKADCAKTMWGFTTAYAGDLSFTGPTGTYNFNVRCDGGSFATGFCSISAGPGGVPVACTVKNGGGSCPLPGEVCVPHCQALGAIYRSSPVIVGPPDDFLRDDGYRAFSQKFRKRRPTMFVASADGVLHAFKALTGPGEDEATNTEMWAFVPPAVLPKVAPNYPSGQQILLDGTPVVKDVVWERETSESQDPEEWHTTLVSGMGAGGPGYYALNVTDADCGGFDQPSSCLGSGVLAPPTGFDSDVAGNKGPHFLWQLTDFVSAGSTDKAKKSRIAPDGTQMVALFGQQTGNPAITTLQVDLGSGLRQIGVAVLPGGIDGAPVKDGKCLRGIESGYGSAFDRSDTAYPPRQYVRQWGESCTAPVPGRGVTIVRLDTGEILAHFGRKNQDVPQKLVDGGVVIDSPFDSPVIGTPVVYPTTVGATAQKIFVGDADGTVWRIDVSSHDRTKWKATLFQDLISTGLSPAPASPAFAGQPIQLPPVLSVDGVGNLVLNVATGDQENISASSDVNYVYSIQEERPTSPTVQGRSKVLWYKALTDGERVTGPMVTFDRVLYFATFAPSLPTSAACSVGGKPWLWGMDYATKNSTGGVSAGGEPRWCKLGQVDAITGACKVAPTQKEDPVSTYSYLAGQIIPGVTLRASQSCAQVGNISGTGLGITGMTSTKFELSFGFSAPSSSSGLGTPTAGHISVARPLPRVTANVDAWAFVID